MNHKHSLLALGLISFVAATFVACGSDSSTNGGNGVAAGPVSNADYEVDDFEYLPQCTPKKEGATGYVVDEKQGYVCRDEEWVRDNDAVEVIRSSSSSGKTEEDETAKSSSSESSSGSRFGKLVDSRDGQTYKTVKIGNQVWMAENLNYDYNYGSAKSYVNKDHPEFGRYYTWAAAMAACPEGWHLPAFTEWEALYRTMGQSPYAMQAKGFEKWPDATDEFGFSVLPAGDYCHECDAVMFSGVGSSADFRSSTEYNGYFADDWILLVSVADLYTSVKHDGSSVRCLLD